MPRHLVTRPGESSADVLASTTISSWVQPENQTAPAISGIQGTPGGEPPVEEGAALGGEDIVNDPPAPSEPPGEITEFAQALTTAMGGAPGISGAMWRMVHTTWHTKSGNPSGEDDDAFYLSHTLEGTRAASSSTVMASPQDLPWKEAWRPDWPAGAIGYEVEQVEIETGLWVPIAEPLSAEFTITLTPSTYFGAVTGLFSRAALNSQWGSGDVAWSWSPTSPPQLQATVHQEAPRTLVAAEDPELGGTSVAVATEGLLDPPHVAMVTVEDFSYAPPNTGLIGFHYTVGRFPGSGEANPVPVLDDGVAIEVSANAELTGVYTVRPPRIRWIYDTALIRQTSHRDDHLAGGAYQTWPSASSEQLSNQTFGGYL